MTISSSVRVAGPFTGNDVTTAFPFAFKVFAAANVLVVQLDEVTEIESTLVLTTDYTVSLNADQNTNPGGTVTLLTALATDTTLTITSSIAALQPTDLTNQGGFYPAVITNALDRITILIQQVLSSISRSLTLPLSTPAGVSTELPLPSSRKLIGWNTDADGLENYDSTALATLVAYGTANADIFDGDGATTVFALSANPAVLNNLAVSISGVTQTPGVDYTWTSGTNLTFTTAPPVGTDNVLVRYMQGLPAPDTAIRAELLASTGAGMIGTADAGGFYATSTVEGNLQELGSAARVDISNAWTSNQKITLTGNNIPSWSLYRNDSTPNAGDVVGEITFECNNSGGFDGTYGSIESYLVSIVPDNEFSELGLGRVVAGSLVHFRIGRGLYSFSDGLSDMGDGTGNFTEVYRNGVAIPGAGLGVGQTWATQTRSVGTTYTNSTGKPIAVALTYTGSATTITVAGALIYTDQSAVAGSTITGTVFVVPDGATYVVGGATVSSWFELR